MDFFLFIEKEKALKELGEKQEKEMAKKVKHSYKPKSQRQKQAEKKGRDMSSRGH